MVEPQTVSEVIARLEKDGYTEGFKSHKEVMRIFPKDIEIDPEDLIVDKIYRFEGETNLDDEEIIFALSCPKLNIKGTYVVAFGSKMDVMDTEMVHKLQRKLQGEKSK